MSKIRAYRSAVFLSAFLLFQIQPMTSKALLPGFGGSYLVWAGCMVFYQGVLLAGYVYAHFAQRWLGVGRYARLHWLLLLAPAFFFPFHFECLNGAAAGMPLAAAVFFLLLVTVGLPFFTLSTTSLVLQRWLAASDLPQRENPYVLYAASHLGSMLALLTYPVLVEPFMGLEMQGYVWWVSYSILVLLHIGCWWMLRGRRVRSTIAATIASDDSESATRNPFSSPFSLTDPRVRSSSIFWFFLSLSACFSLLAVTNVITFDVASVPFLWILPLAVYLSAFVLTFKRKPWFPKRTRDLFHWAVALGLVLHLVAQLHLSLPPGVSLTLQLLILFVLCLNCAGMLAAGKPEDPRDLTTFYVVLALGGLVGSFLVAWVAPVVSSSLVELPVALVLVALAQGVSPPAALCAALRAGCQKEESNSQHPTSNIQRPSPEGSSLGVGSWALVVGRSACIPVVVVFVSVVAVPWLAGKIWDEPNAAVLFFVMGVPVFLALRYVAGKPWQCAAVLLAATIGMMWTEDLAMGAARVKRLRNFYGIYKVFDKGNLRYLQHGTTQHGRQYLSGPEAQTPLGYYHPTTPAAEVLMSDVFHFAQIGMIGLGTGALTCYAGSNQVFTVYELDPDNLTVARENFTYLDVAEERGVDFRFVPGDGRLSVRKRKSGTMDLLIVDAFNSGSIPVHLLTVEALQDYAEALGPGGMLLMHVSNKILELRPVLEGNAAAAGLAVCRKDNAGRTVPDAEETYWMAFSRDPHVVETLVAKLGWWKGNTPAGQLPKPWTDRYSNLIGAVRWK